MRRPTWILVGAAAALGVGAAAALAAVASPPAPASGEQVHSVLRDTAPSPSGSPAATPTAAATPTPVSVPGPDPVPAPVAEPEPVPARDHAAKGDGEPSSAATVADCRRDRADGSGHGSLGGSGRS